MGGIGIARALFPKGSRQRALSLMPCRIRGDGVSQPIDRSLPQPGGLGRGNGADQEIAIVRLGGECLLETCRGIGFAKVDRKAGSGVARQAVARVDRQYPIQRRCRDAEIAAVSLHRGERHQPADSGRLDPIQCGKLGARLVIAAELVEDHRPMQARRREAGRR